MEIIANDQLKLFLEIAHQAALRGAQELKRYWGKVKSIESKGFFWDLVTEADLASERVILDYLKEVVPGHHALSEEKGLQEADRLAQKYLWVIDPLDGTTNYTHQYPFVAVSIGLLYQGRPIVGAVYNPIMNELFLGAHSLGATCNGQRMQVSKVKELSKSLLATGFAYDRQLNPDNNYAEFCHVTDISQGVRRGGAASLDLAYVAAGRLDGFWERGLKPWDMAAGMVLIEEAGGSMTNYQMKSVDLYSGRILATNGHIHAELSRELTGYKGQKH